MPSKPSSPPVKPKSLTPEEAEAARTPIVSVPFEGHSVHVPAIEDERDSLVDSETGKPWHLLTENIHNDPDAAALYAKAKSGEVFPMLRGARDAMAAQKRESNQPDSTGSN